MSNGGMTNNEQQKSEFRTDLSLVRRSPFPWSLFVILPAALLGGSTSAHGQNECTVESTFLGRWYQVDLECSGERTAQPRAAVVPETLRACPLLAGDRVAVAYENDDPARRPTVQGIVNRGESGPNSGDWCNRAFPPGLYTGPCLLEESPPRAERTDTLGASWERKIVHTMFRDTADDRWSVSAGACRPVELAPGVYRIYVTEEISRGTRKPGPTFSADRRLIDDVTFETNRFEGGIFVDSGMARVDFRTDVSPLVRRWALAPSEAVAQTQATSQPAEASPELPPYVGCGEAWDSFLAEADKEPPATVSVTPAQRDTIEHNLTVSQIDEARSFGQLLAQGSSFPAVQQRWEDLVADLGSGDVPLDVDALVQWVLRESYRETTTDLRLSAERIRAYNEKKEAIRDYLGDLRERQSEFAMAARDSSREWTVIRPPARLVQVAVPGDPRLAPINNRDELAEILKQWEDERRTVGCEDQLADMDLQDMLRKQQQTMQMMSNISKMLHDTAMAVIRKIGG